MATVFTEIIEGTQPARFVWRDDVCVAFLDSAPLSDGHVLVVPVQEIDKWTDAPDDVMAHIWKVVGIVGKAQKAVFPCRRIGVMVAGYEVPHLHVHTFPSDSLRDFDFAGKDRRPDPERLEANATALREALIEAGHGGQVAGID